MTRYKNLGFLERVDPRDVWITEDRDFTPWLAQEDNLKILADTVGMELELEAQEKEVGPFRADILCKDVWNDAWVLIENQLERTDHKHLGQLLTYAAGLKAVTIIWVSSEFTEEHRATLDWLNAITDDNFRFFGLKIELWRISGSLPAPKFGIVSQPNDWSKTVAKAARRITEEGITEVKSLQLRYWQALGDFLQQSAPHLRSHTPKPRHWQIFPIGRSGAHISAIVNTRDKRIGVELILNDKDYAKAYYRILLSQKQEIEQEIGHTLEWHESPDTTRSKIALLEPADPLDEATWPEQHQWFRTTVMLFDRAFRNRVRAFDQEPSTDQDEAA